MPITNIENCESTECRCEGGGAKHTPGPLAECEQRAVLGDLMGLECLINYHDAQEVGAEAADMPHSAQYHAKRSRELLELGRRIIEADPDLWADEQKSAFAFRHDERAAIARATTVPNEARDA